MLNETYRGMLAHKSVIRETFMYGKQRAAEIGYENVFDYSLGNPSVPCPPQFTQAMQNLLETEGPVDLHGYCPSQGDPGFRTAVADHLAKTFGLPYAQKDIFPTTGAAGAIAHAIRAVRQQPALGGLYHLAASGETSWHAYACFVLEQAAAAGVALKVPAAQVGAIATSAYPTPAKRPANSRLNTQKLQKAFALHLPHWQAGVARMLTEVLETTS